MPGQPATLASAVLVAAPAVAFPCPESITPLSVVPPAGLEPTHPVREIADAPAACWPISRTWPPIRLSRQFCGLEFGTRVRGHHLPLTASC